MEIKQKLFSLYILSVIFTAQGFAQIKVESRYEANNDAVFDVESDQQGTYTLVLTFTESKGYRLPAGNKVMISVTPGARRSVYRLKYEGDNSPYYRYTYTYYLGRYSAKPNMDYPYILPITAGKSLNITRLEDISIRLGKATTDSILGVVFNYSGIDTVCAMRSGTVVNIWHSQRDKKNPEDGFVYYEGPSVNLITIEHADGSIIRYMCITPVKVLPKEGDRIIAGQPIAVFTKEEGRNRMGIQLYHLTRDLKKKIIIPKFHTEEGLIQLDFGKKYQSIATKEIIEKELTKKEKKNLNR